MHTNKNAFGYDIDSPHRCLFEPEIGRVIQQAIRHLLEYLTGSVSKAERVFAQFLDLARIAANEGQLEVEGYRLLCQEEHFEDLLRSKLDERANRIIGQISLWVTGRTLLDVGCGDGLIGASFSSRPMDITLYDVCNYLDPRVTCRFVLGSEGAVLPLLEQFDTVLLLTVLHHASDPKFLIESVFGVTEPSGTPVIQDVATSGFIEMDHGAQLKFACFFDWFYNRVLHREVPVPYNYNKPEEWRRFFEAYGFRLRETSYLGVDQRLVPEYHVLYVLDIG